MLRVTRPFKARVPHSLALVGALLLITSLLAGTGLPEPAGESNAKLSAGNEAEPRAATVQATDRQQPNRRSGFRTSLFLFRR